MGRSKIRVLGESGFTYEQERVYGTFDQVIGVSGFIHELPRNYTFIQTAEPENKPPVKSRIIRIDAENIGTLMQI